MATNLCPEVNQRRSQGRGADKFSLADTAFEGTPVCPLKYVAPTRTAPSKT